MAKFKKIGKNHVAKTQTIRDQIAIGHFKCNMQTTMQ